MTTYTYTITLSELEAITLQSILDAYISGDEHERRQGFPLHSRHNLENAENIRSRLFENSSFNSSNTFR